MTYIWVGIGGALGSVGRAWLVLLAARLLGPHFPWGTIFINIAGSFIIGLFAAMTAHLNRFWAGEDMRAFVMVGICGGFTTFSSFSLQTLELIRGGRLGYALANVLLSVLLCLAAVAAGHLSGALIRAEMSP